MQDTIGFLLSDVSRLMRRRFDERARSIGVTRSQWRVLTALKRFEGISQGKLADFLEVEPITLSRMIDRLEDAGHVERRHDPADRRTWRIYLTPKSRPLIDQLRSLAGALTEPALAGLDDDQRAALMAMLQMVQKNLNQLPDQGVATHG